jgi:hypothetical protein
MAWREFKNKNELYGYRVAAQCTLFVSEQNGFGVIV